MPVIFKDLPLRCLSNNKILPIGKRMRQEQIFDKNGDIVTEITVEVPAKELNDFQEANNDFLYQLDKLREVSSNENMEAI